MDGLFLGLTFLAVFGAVLLVGDYIAKRREVRLDRRTAPGRVDRYPGCISCEGAEAVSLATLIRHQATLHEGGVLWR